MKLKEFVYSYEPPFDYASPAHKTSHHINLLACSPELLERFLDGKTILEKLIELLETSEFISSMYIEYYGICTIEGPIVFQIDNKTQYVVTVSHDDFTDFAEIMKDYEVIDEL